MHTVEIHPVANAGKAAGAEASGPLASSAADLVRSALDAGDIDGHIAALVLQTGHPQGALGSRWSGAVARMLTQTDTLEPLRTVRGVATAGLRYALGTPAEAGFAEAARRELLREEMAPAPCVRSDERILIGVAAGVGSAAPELESAVSEITAPRRHRASLRQACLDVWAEALAAGAPRFTEELASRALSVLRSPAAARPKPSDEDHIATFWLATRLLDAPWNPTDEDLAFLQGLIDSGRRAVQGLLVERDVENAVDAGLVLDSLSAAPGTRFARRSALQGVLAVVDHFAASAHVLANRHAGREPFIIADEYDVQDLFRALVLPVLPDLQPEDPAPRLAGKSVRLDFTSRAARLGFELKHVKSEGHAAIVRKEVLLDERTYQEHPFVEIVVVFVYDPERHIALGDRAAFETDLSQIVSVGPRTVRYITLVR